MTMQNNNTAIIESRCGLVCSECGFREQTGCPGCVNTDKIFWGECTVKKCCESKNKTNCGQCESIPCQTLTDFSYDSEHGDGGERIDRCKQWSKSAVFPGWCKNG